jgi:regulation of enolase protein 1 (concanavalin A-like superfamily)
MVVSVVTDGRSDDANAFVVGDGAVRLRISRLGAACALHARLVGEAWRFVRHFAVAPDPLRAGFLAQSPVGDGATARFDEIGFIPERLTDLRSGI